MKKAALLFLLLLLPANLLAQTLDPQSLEEKARFSTYAASSYQFKSGMDGGGDVSIARYGVAAGGSVPLGNQTTLGIRLNYLREDFDFSGANTFPVQKPWGGINHLGLRVGLGYKLNDQWSIGGGPVVNSAGESGAKFGDSLMYGGILRAMYRANQNLTIGFGGGVFYRLSETRFFPALFVSWKITDRLRLGNSYALGVAGPAGLELAYKLDDNWETALGAGHRSSRFRLDQNGTTPGGIGENSSLPVYARISRKLGSVLHLDLYGGAAFNGKMKLQDNNGNDISSINYQTSPIMGVNLRAGF